eukprot:g8754.t1
MSVGAGFSTRENVSYIGRIKGQVESTRNLLPAVGRLIAAVLHISLTGTCAFFLAVSLFKGKAYRWAKYLGWALMVVAHGSFDAFLTFNQAVPLHECYFRATCDQTTRKCTIDKKGMLAGCRCSSGVDPETRRCKGRKANGNTSELTLSTDFTDLAKAEDFWELAADRRWGADCNQLPENSYICGAVYVSWFPIWPAPILGLLIIITFTLLGCCATPRLERSFQSSAGSELCHVISPKLHANISERSVAEVVGFIGLIMKERGDLLEACRLYQKSVLMASDHGSLHTYSLRRDDLRAVAWGKRFMQKQQLFAPVLAALDGKSVSDDAKIFGVKDFAAENEFHDALAIGLVTFKLLFLAQPRGFESKGEPSWLKRLKTMEIESHIVGPGVLSLMEDMCEAQDTWRRRSEMDASMLVGAQKHNQVLKRLCGVLEKCCQGHDLHLTPVRTLGILKIFEGWISVQMRALRIFLLGFADILARESSEAVPKAPTNFKPMFVDDQHFILIPLLVTGVKLWHLREESKFFTVFSFWDKLQIIPIETPVMFLLGEIDCREGVLTTVQKGKYTSFDDALRTIVNVYLDVLVQVRRKLTSNRIFVHPVPSDSDWSQNSMNKARVKLLKIQSIFDSPVPEDADITTLSKLQLLPDLRLDGIHLNLDTPTSPVTAPRARAAPRSTVGVKKTRLSGLGLHRGDLKPEVDTVRRCCFASANRRKTLDAVIAEMEDEPVAETKLGLIDLLCIGVGSTVGSGVFVLTGQGPAELLVKDLSLDTVRPEALEWLTSRLPEVRTGRIITAKRLEVRQLFDEETSTLTYLVTCPETSEAVLIDPVLEQKDRDLQVLKELNLKLKYVINTHCHADHITSGGLIRKDMPEVKTIISEASGAKADMHIKHGDTISFGKLQLEVRATPGHTDGCVTFILKTKTASFAFTGDTLLIRGCGRTDFQQGNPRLLYQNVYEQIFTLPGETFICPGHDYKGRGVSSVEEERRFNPRLTKSVDEFAELMDNLGLAYPKKIDVAVPGNMILSWVFAGIACLLSGFAYMELSARLPTRGSCYTFSYHGLGELWAVIGAFCITLEYGISGAGVARNWSQKMGSFLGDEYKHTVFFYFGKGTWPADATAAQLADNYARNCSACVSMGPLIYRQETEKLRPALSIFGLPVERPRPWRARTDDNYLDLSAAFLTAGCTLLLMGGLSLSKAVVNFMTFLKVLLVIFMVICGFIVCCLSSKAKNASRTMPLALIGTLAIAAMVSFTAQLAISLISQPGQASDFGVAFEQMGWTVISWIVRLGELILLPLVVLLSILPQPEVSAAMSTDRLIPSIFRRQASSLAK